MYQHCKKSIPGSAQLRAACFDSATETIILAVCGVSRRLSTIFGTVFNRIKGGWKMSSLRLYDELANWWLLLSPPEEYVDEVAFFLQALRDAGTTSGTMLDLGSGGGSNAFHLKQHF